MKVNTGLFTTLSIALMTLLLVVTLAILGLGIHGFRFSNVQVENEIRRHQLLTSSRHLRNLWSQREYDRLREELRSTEKYIDGDQISLEYLRELEFELSKVNPVPHRILALFEGWSFYQAHEVLRSVDDLQERFRSLIFNGWTVWITLLIVLALISGQIIRTVLRPIRYLSDYFHRAPQKNDLELLFSRPNSRQESGIDDAAPELSDLFDHVSALIDQAREFRRLNVSQFFDQKTRPEALARASRDAVFFLKGSDLFWCNSIGIQLLGANESWFEQGVFLGTQSDLKGSDFFKYISVPVEVTSPKEVVFFNKSVCEECSYLISGFRTESLQIDGSLKFDSVIIVQDITWIRQVERAKSHFIGLLSHEVKTPLTSLLMATRLLQRSDQSKFLEVQKKLMNTTATDVERLCSLIEELFAASRYQLNQEGLSMSRVNIRRVISQSIRSVQGEADAKGVSFQFSSLAEDKLLNLYVDASRVSWSITQILTYTIRRLPKQCEIHVSLDLIQMSDERMYRIRIQSKSDGLLNPEKLKNFENGFNEYDLRVARTSSTGMGLAIAREIVKGHGGTLTLSLDSVDGLEFALCLPMTRRDSNQMRNLA